MNFVNCYYDNHLQIKKENGVEYVFEGHFMCVQAKSLLIIVYDCTLDGLLSEKFLGGLVQWFIHHKIIMRG